MSALISPAQSVASILVVDDHDSARQSMAEILSCVGHNVSTASSAREALAMLMQEDVDVIITDLRMPGMSGLEFIQEVRRRGVESQIAMVTAHASVETAVDAMRYGAFDYIEKPFDVDQLECLVQRAIAKGQGDCGDRSTVPATSDGGVTMIGDSSAMTLLRKQISQIAPTDETVLIVGESGCGKELVAQSIHENSRRNLGALVSLNCPALSPQLMESELFGHEQGAFTSADAPRVGRFELADGGSILLDEVTEIDLPLQAKLLRVLQERVYERVGSSDSRSADVRVIATTNRDLRESVSNGAFREDLYFRLAVLPITVPPLRQRLEDVLPLANHFLAQAAARSEKLPAGLKPDAVQLLHDYNWPGNIRELENLMTRATVLSSGDDINADQLRPWLIGEVSQGTALGSEAQPSATMQAGMSLQEMERKLIEATLDQLGGHRERTAKALGIGVRTLANKLRSYGYAPREKSYGKAG